jgi:predicted Zn-dependent peptidase
MANLMDEQMKQPDFWMARTSQLAYRDQKVEDIMGLPEFFQTVTAQQIKDVFNQYYLPEHKMSLIVSPATAAAPTGG